LFERKCGMMGKATNQCGLTCPEGRHPPRRRSHVRVNRGRGCTPRFPRSDRDVMSTISCSVVALAPLSDWCSE
jgi:hypothetical protein